MAGNASSVGTNGHCNETASQSSSIETDLLIIGAGPAGASLACFLAQHGRHLKPHAGQYTHVWNRIERNHAGGDA